MAFTVNQVTIDSTHRLATVAMHETQNGRNRVVYVVVPFVQRPRLGAVLAKRLARAAAKDALQDAAAAL